MEHGSELSCFHSLVNELGFVSNPHSSACFLLVFKVRKATYFQMGSPFQLFHIGWRSRVKTTTRFFVVVVVKSLRIQLPPNNLFL